jgi:hypothetical protein
MCTVMKIPKSSTPTRICAIFLLYIWLASPGLAHAATHWVSPTGAAAWASCVGSTPLTGASACPLATANANAAAGDVINLRAGTYGTGISPSRNGNGTSLPNTFIAFQAYTGETPIIATTGVGNYNILLDNISYIRVDGITFTYDGTSGGVAYISDGANHNEIKNCTFNSPNGNRLNFFVGTLATTSGGPWATQNWIHDNHFVTSGQAHGNGGLGCTDGGGDTLDVGHAYGSPYVYMGDDNNSIENNFFEHTPHASLDTYGKYTVVRNNVFHNEPWSLASAACQASASYPPTYSSSNPSYSSYNNYYGHRNFEIDEDFGRPATYMLVEGNRIGYGSVNQANGGADDLDVAAPQNIVRYNFMYGAMNLGIRLKYAWGGGLGGGGNGGTYNRIYNNTLYRNGYGYPYASSYPSPCSSSSCPWGQSSIGTENSSGNVVKNNLFYLSASYTLRGFDVDTEGAPANGWSTIVPSNNWCSGSQTGGDTGGCSAFGNPNFTNPDLSNTASKTLPDLSLQPSSPAIDGGTFLTTATNAGSGSTSLTVADALYFQDGTWGSDLARASAGLGGTMQADWIAIGTVGNVVQIGSVTYGAYNAPAGTITLASPMTWSNGAHIWLYKKSDGAVVLNGAAPDYGASEFGTGSTGSVAPPSNLQVAVQ